MEIFISKVDDNNYNPFSATPDELVANALNESGLLTRETKINDKPANLLCQAFYKKREIYKKTSRLGIILIRNSIISEEQLETAIEQQKQQHDGRLGETLVELNFCSEKDVDEGLKFQTEIRSGLKNFSQPSWH